MSYTVKSALVMVAAFVIAVTVAVAVFVTLAFTAFGAYMPDGLSLTGYVYGVTDTEGVVGVIAMVAAMIAAMTGTIAVGERVIA